jgi:hypothetical protein
MRQMKPWVLIDVVLRIATFGLALIPQVVALAFFAFSVKSSDLALALMVIVALAVLTFLPRLRRNVVIAILAAIILVAESLWEFVDMRSGSEVAFSTAANLTLGVLWIVFHIGMSVFGLNAGKSRNDTV